MRDSQKDQEVRRYLENKTKENQQSRVLRRLYPKGLERGLKENCSLRPIDAFLSEPSETSHTFMCQLAGTRGVLFTAETASKQSPEMRLK